ncbi:uncharacterized protein LOC122304860 [Carya illinoinensis]|uniref:uncharacterized protein LOC122304860 n=1 Tax=Carya illinoinensis TaxID=32201 RepID=UPI001C71D327|nr:uncharacterized protein LOC122304860 [Carya illinoinensis]
MAEELSNLCAGLRLTEEEKQEVHVLVEEVLLSIEKSKRCLVALVVADNEVNKGAFQATMSKAWKVEGQVLFKELGSNKVLIGFQNVYEKERVLEGRPWSFDRSLVCLFNCEGCLAPKDFEFNIEPFWLQLHDLPFVSMNKTMGEKVGAAAGQVVSIDVDAGDMAWRSYLRVRVSLDITKPLIHGKVLSMGGKRYWIPFKYERLPIFCFQCGAIKHEALSCSRSHLGGKPREEAAMQYGSWLRASSQ